MFFSNRRVVTESSTNKIRFERLDDEEGADRHQRNLNEALEFCRQKLPAPAATALDLFDEVRAITWRLVHPTAE